MIIKKEPTSAVTASNENIPHQAVKIEPGLAPPTTAAAVPAKVQAHTTGEKKINKWLQIQRETNIARLKRPILPVREYSDDKVEMTSLYDTNSLNAW